MFLAHRLHTNMLARKRGVFLERPLRRRLDDSSFIIYTTSSYSVARRSVGVLRFAIGELAQDYLIVPILRQVIMHTVLRNRSNLVRTMHTASSSYYAHTSYLGVLIVTTNAC